MSQAGLPEEASGDVFDLCLYVAGTTPRSLRALEAVRKMCEGELAGRYSLAVVDIYQHPEVARTDQILAVPTLVKRAPGPKRVLIGDLADQDKLLRRLDVHS